MYIRDKRMILEREVIWWFGISLGPYNALTLASYCQRNMGTDMPTLFQKERFFGFSPCTPP